MRTIFEPAQSGSVAPIRMLMLPAAFTGPEDYVKAGFVAAARERCVDVDLVFVETRMQHLTDRTVLRRLRHEIVLPARALGCRSVWLGGISIGGYIALAYAERYGEELDGLCLFAPYLGNHIVTGEIERARGVTGWEPGELAEDDDERRIWRFIKRGVNLGAMSSKGLDRAAPDRGQRIPLHLGFGREDRFSDSHWLMAATLPPESVDTVPGGHEWPVWLKLWENFLDRQFI